jgi:hypothetical protein
VTTRAVLDVLEKTINLSVSGIEPRYRVLNQLRLSHPFTLYLINIYFNIISPTYHMSGYLGKYLDVFAFLTLMIILCRSFPVIIQGDQKSVCT